MKIKRILKNLGKVSGAAALLVFAVLTAASGADLSGGGFSKNNSLIGQAGVPQLEIAIDARDKMSGGESTGAKILVRRNGDAQELVFKLESSNSSMIRFSVSEVRLGPEESEANFQFSTAVTPIKTSVTLRALLQRPGQLQAQKTLEIVPAMLKSVTLSQPTLNGTYGSQINCTVELRGVAPPGGIELNLRLNSKNLLLNKPNPRVEAGSRTVIFPIEYNYIYFEGVPIGNSSQTRFNSQTRTIELVVSLEPQNTELWQAIAGIASKVTFDVVPLRVASISVQPASVTGGAESLATFTLNFAPGSGEKARLSPENGSSSSGFKAWARPLGTSCQGSIPSPLEMPLTQGTATHSFKVCTAPVTASTTQTLKVSLRSGDYPVQITIQP